MCDDFSISEAEREEIINNAKIYMEQFKRGQIFAGRLLADEIKQAEYAKQRIIGASRYRATVCFPHEDRTLTLPNGTVIRNNDVLVNYSLQEKPFVCVTGIGKYRFFAERLGCDCECGACPDGEVEQNVYYDWRPWSEVYPDQPSPKR